MDQIIIGPLSSPIWSFSGDDAEVYSITYSKAVDVVGAELAIDVCTPVVDYPFSTDSAQVMAGLDFDGVMSSDGYIMCSNKTYIDLRTIPYGTVLYYYRDGDLQIKAYIKNVVRTGRRSYRINAISAIGLLDGQKHYGGMYSGTTFSAVLADVIGGAVPYTIDSDVGSAVVYGGYLPYASRRQNLHSLLFAYGVTIKRNASGDMHFCFLSNADSTAVPDDRIYIDGEVDYSALASEVQITEHSYMALSTDETVTEYDNTDGSETANNTFISFRNGPLHDLTTTGTLTISASNENYAIISGTGTLSGKRYTHSTRVLTQQAENSADREQNIAAVTDCTMVTVLNSANVAARMLAYYSSRKTVSAAIVLEGENPGDLLAMNDPYYEAITGFLSTVNATVSSIVKGDCTIITDFVPPQGGNNFSHALLYTGSGSIDFEALLAQYPDKQNDLVQVTLIQGGEGGQPGTDGTRGTDGDPDNFGGIIWGTPGEGGTGGAIGSGGKVFTTSFNVADLANKTLEFSCGEGGQQGAVGGETTLGDWSSASGAVAPNGVANIFTGDIYGLAGTLPGVDGGRGSSNESAGPNIAYNGVTYTVGANGTDAYIVEPSGYIKSHTGGFGGGAAGGANGGAGTDASTEGGLSGIGIGGDGADGADGADATQYGCGGNGGCGGGGAGIGGGGEERNGSSGVTWGGAQKNGNAGKGGRGGIGGPGLLMVLI